MAPRKCTQARLAGEGAGRGGHSLARPRPGGPSEALGPRRRGRGSCYSGRESGPPSAPLPPPPLPRGAPGGRPRGGTRAQAGLGAAPRGGSGPIGPPPGPRRRPAPFPAPRLQLPPGPRAGCFCLLRPAGSGAGRPQGALALPKSGSGRRCPRLAGEAAVAVGAREGPCVLELAAVCSLQEAKHFLHIKKKKKCSFLLPGSRRGYF